MPFEIMYDSTMPDGFFVPCEWADLTGESPVLDFGAPMAKFRVTILLKSGEGERTFALQVADDAAFTEGVRTVGEEVLSLPSRPHCCRYLYAFRGPVRYAKLTMTGGDATYDARLEWTNATITGYVPPPPPVTPPASGPVLTKLEPPSATLGSPSFTLRVLGTGFTETSVIVWNASVEETRYVSATELTTNVNMLTAEMAIPIPVHVRTGAQNSNTMIFELLPAARRS